MGKLKNWVKQKVHNLIHNWYFGLILGITIGFTSTFCYVNGKALYQELFAENKIYIVSASTEVVPKVVIPVSTGISEEKPSEDKNSPLPTGKYTALIAHYFGEEAQLANAVMMCESQGEATREGDLQMPKPSIGLFQISQYYHDYSTEDLKNPEFNIKVAKEIRDKGGWNRWTCYKTGGYQKYL
jgi:hypothetical protein